MAEELDTQLEQPSEAEKRIKQLSEKVKLTSEERDELKRLNVEKDGQLSEKDKKIEFLSSFSEVATKYNGASEFRTEIEERVMKGYTVEDATVSVLNSKGKLIPQKEESRPIAGGSATTAPAPTAQADLSKMTLAEKRSALLEALGETPQ